MQSSHTPGAEPPFGDRTVLIVEDDPSVRTVLERWAAKSQLLAVSYATFEEAKKHLAFHSPDVLVTDIRLQDYNGLHLVALVKDRIPAVTCVVLTAHDDPVLRRDAENLHARYFVKPIGRDDFLAAVEAPNAARFGRLIAFQQTAPRRQSSRGNPKAKRPATTFCDFS